VITAQVLGTRALLLKLEKAKSGTARGFKAGVNAAIISVASEAKRLVHGPLVQSHTGNLSRAIFSKMLSDTTGMVGVGKEAPYAGFVNNGTRPHIIRAVNAKALRFFVGGSAVFAKYVNHPGTKPTLFMETALQNLRDRIPRIVANYVKLGAKGQIG
jgi:HK97 gp10 family phage protein